jgi:squalene-associated FAD-dependent desaturase
VKIAVVGAGWAGLAAAVRAREAGHEVALFEAAAMPGGRARSDDGGAQALDNGQHVLLGGYARTLALMRAVGVAPDDVLARRALALRYPDGRGVALPAGGPRLPAVARAIAGARGFGLADLASAIALARDWRRRGFRCEATLTVAGLLDGRASPRLRMLLLEPLCVAALNTPVAEASAAAFLAVMRDSLFGAPGASDLLLPRRPLAQLLPLPAIAWLDRHGARVHLRRRVTGLARAGARWRVHAGPTLEPAHAGDTPADEFDRVILATPAPEAARLAQPHAPAWSATAAALAHEPIVTLVLRLPRRPWPLPMLALAADADRRPAQFAFRLDAAGPDADRVALVASAAGAWLERGLAAVTAAGVAQLREAFGLADAAPIDCLAARADRRATFRCAAGVVRPAMAVAPGLAAAGDYVDGPYPATLEAAVRSGEAAVAALPSP